MLIGNKFNIYVKYFTIVNNF